jgi:hydroxymethylpyrimidine pyrophosphatase-like HAD family hydrolase
MIIFAIDLDGTLVNKGKPIKKNIDRVNKLYEEKDTLVIIYTARNETIRKRTEEYLRMLGVNYHLLVMGKLRADYYVDDRSVKW